MTIYFSLVLLYITDFISSAIWTKLKLEIPKPRRGHFILPHTCTPPGWYIKSYQWQAGDGGGGFTTGWREPLLLKRDLLYKFTHSLLWDTDLLCYKLLLYSFKTELKNHKTQNLCVWMFLILLINMLQGYFL